MFVAVCRQWVTAHTYVTEPDGPTAFVSIFQALDPLH